MKPTKYLNFTIQIFSCKKEEEEEEEEEKTHNLEKVAMIQRKSVNNYPLSVKQNRIRTSTNFVAIYNQ